jgi:hypothetical protein
MNWKVTILVAMMMFVSLVNVYQVYGMPTIMGQNGTLAIRTPDNGTATL